MKRVSIPLLIITIFIISLACDFIPGGAMATPTPTIKPPDPQKILGQAVKVNPANNTITVSLTEAQVDGLFLSGLQNFNSTSQFAITNPSVKLQNGIAAVSGQVSAGPLKFDFSLSLKPSITSDHKVNFSIVESNFGSFPISPESLSTFVNKLNNSVNQNISSSGGNISIDSVTITDGKMTVQAHR